MTIPLFKSHYSIGKSILTLNPPQEPKSPDSSDSIFDIAQSAGLSKIVLVEDSFMGFLQGKKIADTLGIDFVFGVRLDACQNTSAQDDEDLKKCNHKVIVFAKTSEGCKALNRIYTAAKTEHGGFVDSSLLKDHWSNKDLVLGIPFYDSFLFKNLTTFTTCIPSFDFTSPTFFIENNGLPFDSLVRSAVLDYCSSNNFETQNCKSIYYKNKSDFSSFLTYKLICGRNSFAGRSLSLEKPNFDHMGSDEFCWESFVQKNESS